MIIKRQNKKQPEFIEKKEEIKSTPQSDAEEIDLFDLDNIDFSQRQERRRGDRRRGYRRIDDRNLISRAQEEADTIKDSAAKEGYKSGLEEAFKDIEDLRSALGSFFGAKQDVYDKIAPDILEISVDIARKIVKKELEQDPQIVLNTIEDVLKTISKDENKINIIVNPTQVEFVKNKLPEVVSNLGTDARIKITSDENIDEGGCMVHTSNGVVDATISTQIEIISEALKGI